MATKIPDVHAEEGLPLSADEERVLALYDKLHQLQLEIALFKAQQAYTPEPPGTAPEAERATKAQDELALARASYVLRKDVVDSILTANPILKAIHNGTSASPIERDLLPYVQHRDDASMKLARQSSELQSTLVELSRVQTETLRATRKNVNLTSELLDAAAKLQAKQTLDLEGDPALAARLRTLEAQVKASRQKWKVMKGTASAVVAGSGVDWVKDEELRAIVLDADDET